MSQRDLTVLGCSSQVPTRHRNHNGYLVRWDGEGLLFDPGEGTQRQFIFANVAPSTVSRVFITHFHGDHCLGMAGMFQRLSLDRVPHPVHIYYPASGHQYIERLRRASIYHDQLEVVYHPIESEGPVDTAPGFTIEAYRLDHPVPTFGYRIREPDSRRFDPEKLKARGLAGPVVGRLQREGRVEHGGQVIRLEEVSEAHRGLGFGFVMDTRPCPGTGRVAADLDVLVCESTFLDSEAAIAWDYGHMTVGQAAAVARDAGVGTLILAHFSQRYRDMKAFKTAAKKVFDGRVVVAKDLLQVPLKRRSEAER